MQFLQEPVHAILVSFDVRKHSAHDIALALQRFRANDSPRVTRNIGGMPTPRKQRARFVLPGTRWSVPVGDDEWKIICAMGETKA